MKKNQIAFSILMGFLMIGEGAFLWADAPQFINYQGKLTTPQGSPIETQVTIDFRFYNGAGTLLNGATPASVDVTPIKGVFSVLVPVEAQWFLNPEVYVGITVDGGPEMSPRQRLVSAPYALGVANGSVIGGKNGHIADLTITNDDIATNAGISKSKINFGTGLTSAEIAAGAVTNEKIASGIDATKLTGMVPDASLPTTLDATKLTGMVPDTSLPTTLDATKRTGMVPDASLPTTLDATKLTGMVPDTSLPTTLDATKLTGMVPDTSLPATLDATKLTGMVPDASLPTTLDATKLTGMVPDASLPTTLDAAKLTGMVPDASLPATLDATKLTGMVPATSLPTTLDAAKLTGIMPATSLPATLDAAKLTGMVPATSLPTTIDASKLTGALPEISGAALTDVVAARISAEAATALVRDERGGGGGGGGGVENQNYIQPVYITNDGRLVLANTYFTSICGVNFSNQQVFYFDCNNNCNQESATSCSTTRVEGYLFKS
ncbi:MAG: hypothetical protein IPN19_01090 [Elusimicrobia bacterium]|nr:hypothetical protein [Elusimicrobiota bacterium]